MLLILGGCIGAEDCVRDFIKKKVSLWGECVKCLSKATKAYPQAAYSVFTRSLSCDRAYVQRVIKGNEEK